METWIFTASAALLGFACFISLGGLPGETILALPECPRRAPQSTYSYPAYTGYSSTASPRLERLHARWIQESAATSWRPSNAEVLVTARMEALHRAVEAAARIGGTVEHEDHGSHGEFIVSKAGKEVAILVWGLARGALTAHWVQA